MEEWEAFYHFEPWGAPADDGRAELLANVLWYPNYKGDPPVFFDRDWEETARLEAKRLASITLEDKVHALFAPMAVNAAGEPPQA